MHSRGDHFQRNINLHKKERNKIYFYYYYYCILLHQAKSKYSMLLHIHVTCSTIKMFVNVTYICICLRAYLKSNSSHHLPSFSDTWNSLFCLKMTCRSHSWSRGQRMRCPWLHCHGSCFHIHYCHHCGRRERCGP